MLVIGRKTGQYVMLGENIKVKVVKGDSGGMRLAIDAPDDVKIVRGEVWSNEYGN